MADSARAVPQPRERNRVITQTDVRLSSRSRSFAQGASLAVAIFGCVILLGWVFDISAFKTLLLGAFAVNANAAVSFLLAGAVLWLWQRYPTDRVLRRLGDGPVIWGGHNCRITVRNGPVGFSR